MKRHVRLMIAGAVAAAMGISAAAADEEPPFLGSDYGKNDLPLRESIGGAVMLIRTLGHIFERVGVLPEDDVIRVAAGPVVRLDMLVEYNGQTATSTCTATIVAPTLILTNHHCVPGRHKILKASILINYEEEDDPDAIRLEVETEPAATSGEMDFSFVRIKEPLPDGVQPLPFTPEEVSPGSRLIMIHHPAGRPKMMTQFDCRAHNKQSGQAFELRHVCDTLPGSSGGLLVNSALRPVGLHHTGGLRENDPESYNTATRMTAIREALESLTQPTGSATATPAVSSVTAPVAATPSSTTASQRTASTPPARAQTAPQNAIGGIGGQSADEAARATANSINDILN